jgi:hypothetical protein
VLKIGGHARSLIEDVGIVQIAADARLRVPELLTSTRLQTDRLGGEVAAALRGAAVVARVQAADLPNGDARPDGS